MEKLKRFGMEVIEPDVGFLACGDTGAGKMPSEAVLLDYILKEIAVGKTEKELALQLDFFMLKNGADAPAFETILIGGEETSVPHGVPTDRKIRSGDFITMDFGAEVDGYRSDMTRTVAVGEVSDEQAKIYDIVLDAQMKALEKAEIVTSDNDSSFCNIDKYFC